MALDVCDWVFPNCFGPLDGNLNFYVAFKISTNFSISFNNDGFVCGSMDG